MAEPSKNSENISDSVATPEAVFGKEGCFALALADHAPPWSWLALS